MDTMQKVVKVYHYPANTTSMEKPATHELLTEQQREIDESRKRTEINVRKNKVGLFTADTFRIFFIGVFTASLVGFFILLYITSTSDVTKSVTDKVSDRIVNEVQGGK